MSALRAGLVAAVAASLGVAAWAVFAGDDAAPAEAEPQAAAEESTGGAPAQRPGAVVAAAAPLAPAPAAPAVPPPLKGLDAPAPEPFRPTSPAEDFTTPIAPGHEPEKLRRLGDELQAWVRAPENRAADAQFVGMDCRTPPCVLSLKFDGSRDGAFLDRAEAWLRQKTGAGLPQGIGAGQLVSYSHRLSGNQQRQWFFLNPHPAGTAEHQQFTEAAVARIQAEQRTLPNHNPSADMTDLEPPPPQAP